MTLKDIIFLFKLGKWVYEFNNISAKKVVDESGKVVTKFVRSVDTDGDGVFDSEEEICILDSPMVTLDNGFCLVNKDDEIGLGYPSYRFVTASDVLPVLQESDYISIGDNICIDLDGDDAADDLIRPVPYDGDDDGLPDFEIVVDDDDNGLPDVSPQSPFYPVGSQGYQDIIDVYSDNVPALDKSFHNYTVSEALLFLIAFFGCVGFISKIIRRRKL